MITLNDVYQSSYKLKTIARITDLIEAQNLTENGQIFLKTENLQVTGSFKLRGAYCKISQLTEEEKKKGVIACSAGNHAQGVAMAAAKEGISALICVPQDAPLSKVENTRRYGAEVIRVKGVFDDAFNKAVELQKETGRIFVHPFDDPYIIAGQGTVGLEIMNQLPDVDAVVCPIGGGGLISGVAFTIKALNPNLKVYGVQAAGAPSMKNAIAHKKVEQLSAVNTIADGIAVKKPANITFEMCQKFVDEIVTVDDDEISSAILALMEKQKMITEGAGAVSVAAVMSGKIDLKGKKVACILSGGNIDVGILSRVIMRGLTRAGRMINLMVEMVDRPGNLLEVCKIAADSGANILSVQHDRSNEHMDVNSCNVELRLETRNHEHAEKVRKALEEKGHFVSRHQ